MLQTEEADSEIYFNSQHSSKVGMDERSSSFIAAVCSGDGTYFCLTWSQIMGGQDKDLLFL